MRVNLSFKLPEETEDYKLHYYGPQYSFIIEDFLNWIRSCSKYHDKDTFTTEEIREKMAELRTKYFEE